MHLRPQLNIENASNPAVSSYLLPATIMSPVYTQSPPPTHISDPLPSSSEIDAEQTKLYEQVLAHFTSAADALSEHEKFWLSRECILRYLRATKWKADQAIERLEATLKWRKEFGIDMENGKVTPEHVEPEVRPSCSLIYLY